MQANLVYPEQHAGEFEVFALYGTGPASYTAGTADPITGPLTGHSIIAPCGAVLSQSGTYEARPQPVITGILRPGWGFRYFVVSTGSEYTGTALAAEKFQFAALGSQL